jgi:hypothetical protein
MRHRLMSLAAIVGIVCVLIGSTAATAGPLPPTKVSPAGDYFKAGLKAGTQVVAAGARCTTLKTQPTLPLGTNDLNQIPTTGNPTTTGPLMVPIQRPTLSGCKYDFATSMTATTSGAWTLSLQRKPAGAPANTGTLSIPQDGLQFQISFGTVHCTADLAPAAVDLTGSWTNGTPSLFTVDHAPVTVHNTGDCGTGDGHWQLSFTWAVLDQSPNPGPIKIG